MKTVLSVFCWLGVLLMLASCDSGSSSSSGGRGDWPQVSFLKNEKGDVVFCYNADSNVITTVQVCTWNCALYHSSQPRWVQLTFSDALVCQPTGEEDEDGEPVLECEVELALTGEKFRECAL